MVARKMNASPHRLFTILCFCPVHRSYVLAFACVVRRYCVRLCCVSWSSKSRAVNAVISIEISNMVTSKTNAYLNSKFKHSKFSFPEAFVIQTNTNGLLP